MSPRLWPTKTFQPIKRRTTEFDEAVSDGDQAGSPAEAAGTASVRSVTSARSGNPEWKDSLPGQRMPSEPGARGHSGERAGVSVLNQFGDSVKELGQLRRGNKSWSG